MDHLARLSSLVLTQVDLRSTLVEICRVAVEAIPHADGASLTMLREGKAVCTPGDEWSQTLDELQYAEHEGPCIDAMRTGNVFRVPDLAREPRWPAYAPRAAVAGARSMVSLPMSVHGDLVGALDVYSRRPNAFDAEAVSVAEIIAVHAAVASEVSAAFFHHRDLAANLRDAIHSRAVIEQAKGMLMAARRCGEDEAFAMLVKISQTEGRKVREVAAGIVANPPHFRQTET